MNTRACDIRDANSALKYYTGCAIASFELSVWTKKYSNADRKRLHSIASGMLASVYAYCKDEEYEQLAHRLKEAEKDYTKENP